MKPSDKRLALDWQKNGRDRSQDIQELAAHRGGWQVRFKSNPEQAYNYSKARLEVLDQPQSIAPESLHISHRGRDLTPASAIAVFNSERGGKYWRIEGADGRLHVHPERELHIIESCLADAPIRTAFDYLRRIAAEIGLRSDDGTKLLSKLYARVAYIDRESALAAYLDAQSTAPAAFASQASLLFPFGCNGSQYQAVQNALSHQFSILEGPPGTGKTQTILNLLASIVANGQTALVASQNNSAIKNVLEKWNTAENGLGFTAALLGKRENEVLFLDGQTGCPPEVADKLPDDWDAAADAAARNAITRLNHRIGESFNLQKQLAETQGEQRAIQVELGHFERYLAESGLPAPEAAGAAAHWPGADGWRRILRWAQRHCAQHGAPRPWLRLVLSLLLRDWACWRLSSQALTAWLQGRAYHARLEQLATRIALLESRLRTLDAEADLRALREQSLLVLHSALHRRCAGAESRRVFSADDLKQAPGEFLTEYPVVLSSAFSAKRCLGGRVLFDYLIMDEASQVDIPAGALALSCARNAVVVGDSKQLPAILSADDRKRAAKIARETDIAPGLRVEKNSFLDSVRRMLPQAPRTLLREHYRCHPRIIDFCNQRFYEGELLVMTPVGEDGAEDAIKCVTTAPGHHARGHLNQRQVDVIQHEILPRIAGGADGIGIIAPYRAQAEALRKLQSGAEAATVHAFQGREKEVIILSTVDQQATEFSGDPNLINVAVSRAKRQLWVVAGSDEQPPGSVLGDLLGYIRHCNFEVTESGLRSVFDYLYAGAAAGRLRFLRGHRRVSRYDSENLVHALLVDTLDELNLSALSIACHHPLRLLIRNFERLNDEERRYAQHPNAHVDFLLYSRSSKRPVLAIEVDGYRHHQGDPVQRARDALKENVLAAYAIPLLRFATNGSAERERLISELKALGCV